LCNLAGRLRLAMDAPPSPRLNSYRPLCFTAFGRNVAKTHGLKPFIDGSIRREPDFENKNPSISGLCRLNKFAPTLEIGTVVAYITVQGYYGTPELHWRLVAILKVIKQFKCVDSHVKAREWYRKNRLPVPRNCMVPGNPGAQYELSSQRMDGPKNKRTGAAEWEEEYRDRALTAPAFNITEVQKLELETPPVLSLADMDRIFGRVPGTQSPPSITEEQLEQLFHKFDNRP
jgi:hypothetical protein